MAKKKSAKPNDNVVHEEFACFRGTVRAMHEWLNQFKDTDEIAFQAWTDGGWEGLYIKKNGKIIANCGE